MKPVVNITPELYYAGNLQYRFMLMVPVSLLITIIGGIIGTGSTIGFVCFAIGGIAFLIGMVPMGLYSWVVWWRVFIKRSKAYADEPAIRQGYTLCNPLLAFVVMLAINIICNMVGGFNGGDGLQGIHISKLIWFIWVFAVNIRGGMAFTKYRNIKRFAEAKE